MPRRVLYVEDDRVAALLFVEALRDVPALELQVAEDGAEARELALRWQPEILVLDAHLPDTTGVALLMQLRNLPGLAEAPAFVCSADMPADVLATWPTHLPVAGFAGCWPKPIQRQQVLADLADWLPSSAS